MRNGLGNIVLWPIILTVCLLLPTFVFAESKTFYGLSGRCSSMCPKVQAKVYQICKKRGRRASIQSCHCNEKFSGNSSATVKFSCLRRKRRKRPPPKLKNQDIDNTVYKGLILLFPNLHKLRLGKLSTPWGRYHVYITDKSWTSEGQKKNPIVLSWAAWTLLKQPVLSSTALWWIRAPLYICYQPVNHAQLSVIPVLRTSAAASCSLTHLQVPTKILRKLSVIDLNVRLPVYQKNGSSRHCKGTCQYLQLNPGAFGRPYISTSLNKLHALPSSQKSKLWSFNVPESPRWRRFFQNGALGISFASASVSKAIMREGFTLGVTLQRSIAQAWKMKISTFIRSGKQVFIRQGTAPQVRFDMSPVMDWLDKKVKEDSELQVLVRALQGHIQNMSTRYQINTSWLNGRLQQVLYRHKQKKGSTQWAVRVLKKLLHSIERKSLPSSLVIKQQKKAYQQTKYLLRKKARQMLRALAQTHQSMRWKIVSFQRKIRRLKRGIYRSVRRRGKRSRLCDACDKLISFDNSSIKQGRYLHHYSKFFPIRGRIASDIPPKDVKLFILIDKSRKEIVLRSGNKFSNTIPLKKGENSISIFLFTTKRKWKLSFQVLRIDSYIKITSPSSYTNASKRLLRITGKTFEVRERSLTLSVNGRTQTAPIRNNHFSQVVVLTKGRNEIHAYTSSGIRSKKVVVYASIKATRLWVQLTWTSPKSDLDLYVTEPSGNTACYKNKRNPSGGFLDKDETKGYGPEAYYISSEEGHRVRSGSYKFRIHCFARKGYRGSIYYKLLVIKNETSTQSYTGFIERCSRSSSGVRGWNRSYSSWSREYSAYLY